MILDLCKQRFYNEIQYFILFFLFGYIEFKSKYRDVAISANIPSLYPVYFTDSSFANSHTSKIINVSGGKCLCLWCDI